MKVLVADANVDFRRLLAAGIRARQPNVSVWEADDGETLLAIAELREPEVVVANTFLPGLDGLSALETIRRLPLRRQPELVVVSALCSARIEAAVCALRPAFFTALPCDIGQLAGQILACCREVCRLDFRGAAGRQPLPRLLRQLGISVQSRGFSYLEACIAQMMKEGLSASLTKSLYPAAARRFGTTAANVERAIRSAVVAAWDREGFLLQKRLFVRRPTNGELILLAARLLQEEEAFSDK